MRLTLDECQRLVVGVELEGLVEAGADAHEVVARGRMLGRDVRVRLFTASDLDAKPLVRLSAALDLAGPVAGPGLVPVLAVSLESSVPYVVEGVVAGRPLGELLDAGGAREAVLARVACDLAGGLNALAERGLAHGTLSPASVIITPDGGARLSGLGRARGVLTEGGLAEDPAADYAAPEVLAGEPDGPAADVYALALVLCEIAAGRALFARGATERVTPDRRLDGWRLPPALGLALGHRLASAVVASLDGKPGQRPRAEWIQATAARAQPHGSRVALALAPLALVFGAMVALLVTGVLLDLSQSSRASAQLRSSRH